MDSRTNNAIAVGRQSRRGGGFTLLEVLTALAILALASSSVLMVIDRCVNSAGDSALRMEAFRLARENLEEVLVRDSVEESIEFGTSEKYSDLAWQTVLEAFPEPVTGEMWLRAVCSADYLDSKGETRTVELEHWIMALSDQQAGQIMDAEELEKLKAEQLIADPEAAAQYAKIDVDTLDLWVEDGLVTTEADEFIKYNLDLFVRSNGDPSLEEKGRQVESIEELSLAMRTMQRGLDENAGGADAMGLSPEELEKMDVDEVMETLRQGQR
jgi:prepilin-type N-terminal cleavage/methylation domain-containing protein